MCCTYKPVYAFIDDSVYLYRTNGGSITSEYHDNYISVWNAIASDYELFLAERGFTEEYYDLIAFHLCFGLFFLAKQELTYKGMPQTVKALSMYGKYPLVREMAKKLTRGRYIDQIGAKSWKLMIRIATLLCSLHAYAMLAMGIWILQKIKADERFINSKYAP